MSMIARAKAVQAAGLLTTESSAWEVNMAFGRILSDAVVNERALALGFEVDEETGKETAVMVANTEDYADIIKAMLPMERAALRERLLRR